MVFTKYAVVNAYLREGEESFNASVLSNAVEDCIIFDTQEEAMEAIAENGLDNHIYVVPMIIDTTNIRQVKISLEPVFK
jgi:hypothetical protein